VFIPGAGVLVGGRYELLRIIGRGGMGQVWEATDRELKAPCAVKFILQGGSADRELRVRFERESMVAARLRSPHTVQVLGAGEHDGTPYMAMELLEGESLLDRLEERGRLDAETTLELVSQVARVLDKAHALGIVHRDLKPANIWLCAEPRLFVKVLDFGVAKAPGATNAPQTVTGALVGTPHYMSPEQAKGAREVDQRSDVWSLGVITLECLSGQRPFEGPSVGVILQRIMAGPPQDLLAGAADLPSGLRRWGQRALAVDPASRFQGASELVAALRVCLSSPRAESAATDLGRAPASINGPVQPVSHSYPSARRIGRRGVISTIGAAALIAGALALGRSWSSDPAEPVTSSASRLEPSSASGAATALAAALSAQQPEAPVVNDARAAPAATAQPPEARPVSPKSAALPGESFQPPAKPSVPATRPKAPPARSKTAPAKPKAKPKTGRDSEREPWEDRPTPQHESPT
jgi:serine/threonine-protein kinase